MLFRKDRNKNGGSDSKNTNCNKKTTTTKNKDEILLNCEDTCRCATNKKTTTGIKYSIIFVFFMTQVSQVSP